MAAKLFTLEYRDRNGGYITTFHLEAETAETEPDIESVVLIVRDRDGSTRAIDIPHPSVGMPASDEPIVAIIAKQAWAEAEAIADDLAVDWINEDDERALRYLQDISDDRL